MQFISGRKTIKEKYPEILYDESKYTIGIPDKLFFPEKQDDIIEIVKDAFENRTPVVFIGAQTGITGGSIPENGCTAVSFSRMKRILSIKKLNNKEYFLTCEPGITLREINEFLEAPDNYNITGAEDMERGSWFYPPDPTELTATLGGMVATNASGARSFFFGPTRNHIESLKIVLSDGDTFICRRGEIFFNKDNVSFKTESGKTLDINKPLYTNTDIKNAAGYFSCRNTDLIDLFIGSEGTLGIFSEITIKLIQKPDISAGLTFFPERINAFDFADFLRKHDNIAAIEYFDKSAVDFLYENMETHKFPALPKQKHFAVYWEYIENDHSPFEDVMNIWEKKLIETGTSFDCTWSGFDKKEMEILKSFRHLVPELVNKRIAQIKKTFPEIRKISTDTALPEKNFKIIFKEYLELIKKAELKYVCFGHIGDCHIHINLIPENPDKLDTALEIYRKLMEITVNAHGTVSAEHGIGKLKKEYLKIMYKNNELKEMKKIKTILDPKNILNRNNLF